MLCLEVNGFNNQNLFSVIHNTLPFILYQQEHRIVIMIQLIKSFILLHLIILYIFIRKKASYFLILHYSTLTIHI